MLQSLDPSSHDEVACTVDGTMGKSRLWHSLSWDHCAHLNVQFIEIRDHIISLGFDASSQEDVVVIVGHSENLVEDSTKTEKLLL